MRLRFVFFSGIFSVGICVSLRRGVHLMDFFALDLDERVTSEVSTVSSFLPLVRVVRGAGLVVFSTTEVSAFLARDRVARLLGGFSIFTSVVFLVVCLLRLRVG